MRKINFLLVSLLVVASGFFASCSKDDEGGNSIDFFGGNYIDGDVTVPAGSTLAFKFTATSETSMELLEIDMDGYGVVFDEEIPNASNNSYTKEVTLTAPSNPGTYVYDFQIWDNATGDASLIVSKTITVTVTAAAGQISTYSNINLGASNVTTHGSYLDAEAGIAYKLSDVNGSTTIKNAIDIIFDLGTLYNSTTTALFSSGTGTKFKATTITGTEYSAMTTDANFPTVTADLNTIPATANSVIFFVTKAGKKGLIKVNSLTNSTATGVLNIDIKIQQ